MDDKKPINPDPLKYDHHDTFFLDRPFVLTQDKTLVNGMPYLYTEGIRSVAVRLLKTWVEDDIIYLTLQELQTDRSFTVNWNLDYEGSYYLWSLSDLPTLMNLPK